MCGFNDILQERDTAEKELIRRWSFGNNMPHPTREELHLHTPSEGSDWELLLLPISCIPQSRWWFWRHKDPQQAQNPSPFP